MSAGDKSNEALEASPHSAAPSKSKRYRDLLTSRVVAIFGGALIPLLGVLVPIYLKILDNNKEIRLVEIQKDVDENAKQNDVTGKRVTFLNDAYISTQIELKNVNVRLAESEAENRRIKADFEKGCEAVCNVKIKRK